MSTPGRALFYTADSPTGEGGPSAGAVRQGTRADKTTGHRAYVWSLLSLEALSEPAFIFRGVANQHNIPVMDVTLI